MTESREAVTFLPRRQFWLEMPPNVGASCSRSTLRRFPYYVHTPRGTKVRVFDTRGNWWLVKTVRNA